jgi:uncharacterized membrane protein
VINDATFPYTYQRHHELFTVYRNGDAQHTMVTVNFSGQSVQVSLWLSDEELKDLTGMLSDCLETSKPLFTEVA